MREQTIILENLDFNIDNTGIRFKQLNINFSKEKYGIIGPNGIGKTSLLKLIHGDYEPHNGRIHRPNNLLFLPQDHTVYPSASTIEDVLNIASTIAALNQIEQGNASDAALEIANNNWNLRATIKKIFHSLQLNAISLSTPFYSLSGGEKTKVLIAYTLIHPADFILFDEPTNNLDKTTRHFLYHQIQQQTAGLIIASHDRQLLNLMDHIIELHPNGITHYGGNYDFYQQQKKIQHEALQRDYRDAVKSVQQNEKQAQLTKEKHRKLAERGKKSFQSGKVDKLTAKNRKSRSEKTNQRNNALFIDRINEQKELLTQLQQQIVSTERQSLAFNATRVANNKTVLSIEHLFFRHRPDHTWLLEDLSLHVIGPTRFAIIGDNGSGKSTLLQLIRQHQQPTQGTLNLGVQAIAYLDQHVSLLHPNLSLVDNYHLINPNASDFEAYRALAAFGFRNTAAEKKVNALSGGEKMRAALAINILSSTPPQLILLDEPTNHLDFESINAIENALNCYQGAIIAVSHDEMFLENIHITDTLTLKNHTEPKSTN